MSSLPLVPDAEDAPDRRGRRRQATMQEILRTSLEVMEEEGVGGLSLAEVARRMGIKPPSLYKHVASKEAVYDALFAAGTRASTAAVLEAAERLPPGLGRLETGFDATVRWCIENPTLTQLLYWRPVPGFEPSAGSFAPAVASLELLREALRAAVDAGDLRAEAASEEGVALYTSLVSGIVTQQLANEPGAPLEKGRFTRHRRAAFALFCEHYSRGKDR